MIKRRLRHLRISLRANVHQHRVSLEPGRFQHRNEQGRFVAANAVFIVEGELHVMRLEARPVLFRRQPQVANLLSDVVKHRLDFVHVGAGSCREFVHRFLHLRRRGVQVRFADVPVPFRHGLPIGRGAEQQTLQHDFIGGHRRLIEHARHVVDLPTVQGDPVRDGLGRMFDRSRDLVAQDNSL